MPNRSLLPLAALAAACLISLPSAAIEGGWSDVRDGAVGLIYGGGAGVCTGTLIRPDIVLTAAHCIGPRLPTFYTGQGRRQSAVTVPPGMTANRVIRQLPMPGFVRNRAGCGNNDAALLKLAAPLRGVSPIAFAPASAYRANAQCSVVGFGLHMAGGAYTMETKRRAHVRIATPSPLRVNWAGGIANHGDSGGPLYCNSRIAGVTSCVTDGAGRVIPVDAPPDSAPSTWRSIYTRTDRVTSWVNSTIASWASPAGNASTRPRTPARRPAASNKAARH